MKSSPTVDFFAGSTLNIEGADVYVNAASIDGLDVDSWDGIAKAVRERLKKDESSDDILRKDWDDRIQKKRAPIQAGDADFVYSGDGQPALLNWGNDQKAYLIHAGAPKDGEEDTRYNNLYKAYFATLEKAHTQQLHSKKEPFTVACAPLGIGLYGNEPTLSARAAFEAQKDFFKKYPETKINLKFGIFDENSKLFQNAYVKFAQAFERNEPLPPLTPARKKQAEKQTPLLQHGVINQTKTSVNEIHKLLQNEGFKKGHGISNAILIEASKDSPAELKIQLEAQGKDSKPLEYYIKEKATGGVDYSVKANMSEEEAHAVIDNMCRLAVANAKPGAKFTVPDTSPYKEFTERTLNAYIKKVEKNFPPEKLPKVNSSTPHAEKRKSMH